MTLKMLTANKPNDDVAIRRRSRTPNGGFTALIAVILLSSGTLAFSLATIASALLYADGVNQRELRIQAGLNADDCLDSVHLMSEKDFFLHGTTTLADFNCTAVVINDYSGHVTANVIAVLNGVTARASGSFMNIF